MGTCNFAHPQNASKYFVIGTNREEKFSKCDCGKYWEWEEGYVEASDFCEDCESDIQHGVESRALELWEVDELKYDLIASLNELGNFIEGETYDYDRNYGSTFLGELNKSKAWGDTEFSVSLKPCITSAYYEGATLDYKIEISTYGGQNEHDYNESSMDEIMDDGLDEWHSELNRGLAAIFRPYAERWVENTITELSEQLEKVFEQFSEHKLQRQGVMSNGVGVYETIK